ncbi:MAG: amidohydrolase family protein [Myxococcota bacterium]
MLLLALSLTGWGADSPTVDPAASPSTMASFSVDEGTWMNVDVSPDGSSVAFDLLGHIYTVPLAGGPATRLTSGHAWNMHPRWSPDGKQLAFTSDQGGGDNLWVMNADGDDAHAVTDESFRLVTQPDWTPDGRFIYGRKHFTGTRSLGTGEIWAWDPSGEGSGHAWTEKGHLQADINEPHVDPTGTHLYWSEAGAFDYNRNVYAGIYRIRRLELATGEMQPVAGGSGGALRPQVSPDGKTLGYVRRALDGARSEWVLRDLETGAETVASTTLDRDQQETWSIHGTTPTWDWLPDSSGMVASREGRLVRIDRDGTETNIPFTASVDRPLVKPVRQAHEVAPKSFTPQAIRWPTQSPDGTRVAFVAVGRVWVKSDTGEAVAVSPADKLAYAPSWHPKSNALVYTTWSDKTGGMVWRQAVTGTQATGAPEALAQTPNLYTGPAFDASGDRIVWVAGTTGVTNRGHSGAWEPKLQVQWRTSDDPTVHKAGHIENLAWGERTPRPQFSTSGDRIWITDEAEDHLLLVSVSLDGEDRRVLAKGEYATEIQPSPDGQWLSWKAQHRVYVAPMPPTAGRAVVLGNGEGSLPATRLSHHLGEWIDWSTADTLTYAAGDTLYRVDLSDGLPAVPESKPAKSTKRNPYPDQTQAPLGEPRSLALTVERTIHDQTVAFVGGRVIPMEGDTVYEDGVVVVRGERILAVGAAGDVAIPDGAEIRDIKGKTVIPGLVDVHAHMGYGWSDVSPESVPAYAANLAYGVTTTHDPSAQTHFVFSQRELVEAGRIVGPRIFSTGFILYGAESDDKAVIESLDAARAHLRRIKEYGGFSVKSYNQPRRDQRQWVLRAAVEENMLVVPEGGSTLQHNLTQIVDGHTGIEHALPVEQLREDVQRLWSEQTGVFYTPTLLVGYGGVMGEHAFYQRHEVWKKPRLQHWTPPGRLEARGKRRPLMLPEDDWQHVRLAATAWALSKRGVRVNMGGHGQLQGLGPHWELWALAEGGFTPLEMLRAGTANGAAYLGLDGDIGSLETGKLADLVILDRNPLESVQNTESVHAVMKGGVLYDPDTLATQWPEQGEPLHAWWHAANPTGPTLPWRGAAGDGCMAEHP